MKKKIVSVLLCAAMTASMLIGCGNKDKTTGEDSNGGGSDLIKPKLFTEQYLKR